MPRRNMTMNLSLARRLKIFIKDVSRIRTQIANKECDIAGFDKLRADFQSATGYFVNGDGMARELLRIIADRRIHNGQHTSANSAPFARIGRAALKQGKYINLNRHEIRKALRANDLRQVPFSRLINGFDVSIQRSTAEELSTGEKKVIMPLGQMFCWRSDSTKFVANVEEAVTIVQNCK